MGVDRVSGWRTCSTMRDWASVAAMVGLFVMLQGKFLFLEGGGSLLCNDPAATTGPCVW